MLFSVYFRAMDTLSGEVTLSNCFCPLFENGSTLKGKKMLPEGDQILFFKSRPLGVQILSF